MRRVCAIIGPCLLAACASGPSGPPGSRPPDFAVAATVFSPPGTPAKTAARPRAERPARYIVECDGTLRTALGIDCDERTYPPVLRAVDAPTMDGLWTLSRESGLMDPRGPLRVTGTDVARPDELAIPVALLEFTGDGVRTEVRVSLDGLSEASRSARALVDRLAELSWIRD